MTEPNKKVNFPRLVDWVEGRLSEDEARAVEQAVAEADDATLADVAWLRKFHRATDKALVGPPPQRVRDTLVETFEAHARDRGTSGFLGRVLAALASDSNLQPAAGLRAVGAQHSRRQLIYHADTFDLVINLLAREADNDLDLDGQVLPRDDVEPEPFSVQLLRDGYERALTVVDELGSFALQRVSPGRYEMVLSSARVEVSIRPLDVRL